MIGADIIEIRRIENAIKKEYFLQRVFTEEERLYAQKKAFPAQTFAGIYAAKEAVAKLSGKGITRQLSEIEVVHNDLGAPSIILYGKTAEIFSNDIFVSISHDKDYAFAVASYEPIVYAPVLPGKEIVDGDLQLIKRNRFTHKGDYGRIYVIGGSSNMIGAPLICAQAAVRAGAGLTTLCVPSSLSYAYRSRIKEVMLKEMSDNDGRMIFNNSDFCDICQRADAIVIGPGMGKNPSLKEMIKFLFENFNGTFVCDADAINSIAEMPQLTSMDRKCVLILTPHIGEFNRLSEALGIEDPRKMALEINAVIACKSAYTLVTNGVTDYKITSGCAAMAKGGSGDALAGIVAAYSCRTITLEATALACHYFGRCGEKAATIKGENAVTASDIIDCL